MKSDLENFLEDLLSLLIERAKEARDRSNGAGIGAGNKDYEDGKAQAYYEVVSTTINLAFTFGLSPDNVPSLKFELDKELLS